MRTIGAVLLVIGMLFVGVLGLSVASDSVQDTAMNGTNQTQDMYNLEGTSQTLVQAATWGGFAAIVLTAIGLLIYLSPGGR